jgi:hypothetical protein
MPPVASLAHRIVVIKMVAPILQIVRLGHFQLREFFLKFVTLLYLVEGIYQYRVAPPNFSSLSQFFLIILSVGPKAIQIQSMVIAMADRGPS